VLSAVAKMVVKTKARRRSNANELWNRLPPQYFLSCFDPSFGMYPFRTKRIDVIKTEFDHE
jgi:hypothetical protein